MLFIVGRIPEIEFRRPESINEALMFLAEQRQSARVIAGGTDLIPGLRKQDQRFRNIKWLVDIQPLPDLQVIEKANEQVLIGAGVTFTDLIEHPFIIKHFPLLAKAGASIGSRQIRNRATLAGNFINNAPCADSVPPLLVYDATVRIQSLGQQRELPLSDFLIKPYQTRLAADEIVTQIRLPVLPDDYNGDFNKLGRRCGVAISRITLAVLAQMSGKIIEDLRIASGAVTPIGTRFPALEQMAIGKNADSSLFEELARELGRQVLQVTGLRWSSDYKLPVLQQLFFQMMLKILDPQIPYK